MTTTPNETEIREAYSQHLSSLYWDTYLTVTFKRERHDGTNAVYAVWDRLPCLPVRGFFAVESHKLGGVHLHALLQHNLVENNTPVRTQAYCTKTFGWSRAEWVRGVNAVTSYCAKYVTKGNDFFYLGHPYYWKHTVLDKSPDISYII